MSIKNKLMIFLVLIIIGIGFLFREEFSEGIWFKKINPVRKIEEDFKMFVATDIHYLSSKINDKGKAFMDYMEKGESKQLDYIEEITDTFVSDIEEKKPEFLIISGDLTNNGEKESHLELIEKLKYIESQGTDIFVIPGNHDISNPWASGFLGDRQYKVDTISKSEFKELYNDYGYSESISHDRDTLSYLVPATDKLWFLMLDTNLYLQNSEKKTPEEEGEITGETFEWIKAATELAKKNNAKIITVMHHSLIDHSSMYNKGFSLNYNDKAIKKFREFGLNIVLSGHIHIQDIASDEVDNNKIYDIATATLSVYPLRYGIIEFNTNEMAVEYKTAQLDVESWARRKKLNNDKLLSFSSYSRDFFESKSLIKAIDFATNVNDCTEEEKKAMIDTIKLINERVFLGNDSGSNENILTSPGYKLWKVKGIESQKQYIYSMISDKNINDNEIKIKLW